MTLYRIRFTYGRQETEVAPAQMFRRDGRPWYEVTLPDGGETTPAGAVCLWRRTPEAARRARIRHEREWIARLEAELAAARARLAALKGGGDDA